MPDLNHLFNGLTDESYLALLRRAVLGTHAPEQVILMEIAPEQQKTRPDFLLTEKTARRADGRDHGRAQRWAADCFIGARAARLKSAAFTIA